MIHLARGVFGVGSRTSNPNPSGIPQGTLGGSRVGSSGSRPGTSLRIGDEGYLWILVILEIMAMGFLRRHFRRYHGG